MRRIRLVVMGMFSLALILGVSSQAMAQKIGFLDLSKVFDNYQRTKEYDGTLEKSHKEYTDKRNEKISKIQEAQSKLALLKEEEKGKLQQEMEQMRADLESFDRAQQTDLTRQRDERIREILLEIEKVSSEFAKQEKYDFILNDRVLIFGNPSMDVTEQVLRMLNEGYSPDAAKESPAPKK